MEAAKFRSVAILALTLFLCTTSVCVTWHNVHVYAVGHLCILHQSKFSTHFSTVCASGPFVRVRGTQQPRCISEVARLQGRVERLEVEGKSSSISAYWSTRCAETYPPTK